MSHTSSDNQNNDCLSLDIQLKQTETFASTTQPQNTLNKPPTLRKLFSWKRITKQRIDILKKRQEKHDLNQENAEQKIEEKHQSSSLIELLKTKGMTVAITISMLPLIIFSGVVYYSGKQSINQQENNLNRGNLRLVEENLQWQKKMLLFLLTGAEITAVSVGIFSALWAKRTINLSASTASKATSLTIGLEKKQQLQTLAQIVRCMRQSIEPENIMANAVLETRKILMCDRVIIYRFGQQGRGTVMAQSVEPKFSQVSSTKTVNLGLETKYLSAYQQKRCQVINDIYQELKRDTDNLSQFEFLDVKSSLHVPLEQQGKLIGLLIAHQCSSLRYWQTTEIELFSEIAIEISLALDDAQRVTECLRLQAQLQQKSQWQDYLTDSLEDIHSASNEDDVFMTSVEGIRKVLNCDRVVFYSLNHSHDATVIAESVAAEQQKILGTIIENPYLATEDSQQEYHSGVCVINSVEEGEITRWSTFGEDRQTTSTKIASSNQEQLKNLGIKALIAAPIMHQGQLYGFLAAHQCSAQRCWQESEIQWFTQIAKQVGYALDKVKLMLQAQNTTPHSQKLIFTKPEEKAIIQSQLPIFLQESKATLESFSEKIITEVDTVTSIFQQMQVMTSLIEGLTSNINQTKLQSQQVDGILRVEHENIDLTEDRLLNIQQNLKKIAIKNINLGQSCQQFIQAVEKIRNLAEEINQQVTNTTLQANNMGVVPQQSLLELKEVVYSATEELIYKADAINLFLGELKIETEQITNTLETTEEKTFVGIEIVQESRQNLNQINVRNQELNQLLERITLAATIGEQNSNLAQQSLMELANLADQAAQKSVAAVKTIASLTTFLQKL